MWSFQYKNGDRPLEGFTIQRAAGRGGFGEVYYALSDSGREVALKVVQGYEQIELRGISQCMNLKSPHLVTIFDVKYNAEGRPFVIMEFVGGPNLRQMLDESPAGLGTQKAAFFLREMGKGLTFLHECGIVHRDLKPANVFFENGYVKIGDYGLSKAISPTQHSGQTVTVGTVHYMAPEVGAGKYDRSIDIYALGTVLYEMLTGTVPFIGASPSEILIKHLSAEPDLSGVPAPFDAVVRKAMAKNPADRYQSVQEMVEAVFGAEHVRMSVSHFSPDDLSMVAGRVAQKVALGGTGSGGGVALGGGGLGGAGGSSSVVGGDFRERVRNRIHAAEERIDQTRQRVRDRLHQLGVPVCDRPAGVTAPDAPNDALPLRGRQALGVLAAGVAAAAAGLINGRNADHAFFSALFVFTAVIGASIGLLVAWRHIVIPKMQRESRTLRRLVVAGVLALSVFIFSGIFAAALAPRYFEGQTWIAILAPLVLCDTSDWLRSTRKERVSIGPAIGTGVLALIAAGIFHGNPVLAMAVVAGTALAVQVVAPWDPEGLRTVASPRADGLFGQMRSPGLTPNAPSPGSFTAPQSAPQQSFTNAPAYPYGPLPVGYRSVPRGLPFIWLGFFIITLTISLMTLIGVATGAIRGNDLPPAAGCGWAAAFTAVFCFTRVFKKKFVGWWSYLIRPVFLMLCINSILISAIVMGNMNRLNSEEQMLGVFFIVFPAILLLSLPFVPSRFGAPLPAPAVPTGPSPHSRGGTLGMACLWFCGIGGAHRFYVGKIGTGILWLVTFGFFGVGQLIDAIMIMSGRFRDAEGRLLTSWDSVDTVYAPPPPPPGPSGPMGPAPPTVETSLETDAKPQAAPPTIAPIEPLRYDWIPPVNQSAVVPPATSPPRVASGGIASVIAALFVLVTMVVALAIGFDLPHAVASGLPNANTAQEIRRSVFDDYPNWPALMMNLLYPVCCLLAMLALGTTILARRNTSIGHIFRGVLGIIALLLAVAALTGDFQPAVWDRIAEHVSAHQGNLGMEEFLNRFHSPGPAVAAGITLIAFLLLGMPCHRREKGTP